MLPSINWKALFYKKNSSDSHVFFKLTMILRTAVTINRLYLRRYLTTSIATIHSLYDGDIISWGHLMQFILSGALFVLHYLLQLCIITWSLLKLQTSYIQLQIQISHRQLQMNDTRLQTTYRRLEASHRQVRVNHRQVTGK